MSWQDELRQLDVQLADGRIEHTEYRKMRDELLAAASSSGITDTTTSMSWHSANPGHETDPQHPSTSLLGTDRQTSAPSPADNRHTDAIGFPPIAPAPIPRSRPPGQLPPLRPATQPPGPEPAAPARTRNKPVWAFLSLGVFLVLAMIIGATWWLGSSTDSPSNGTPFAAGDAPPVAEPVLPDRLPDLPGEPSPNNSTMSIDRGLELHLYSTGDAQLMRASGASEVIYRASAEGPAGYMLLVVPTSSTEAANALADELRTAAVNSGLSAVPGTEAVSGENQLGKLAGTWYSSSRFTVCVWASTTDGSAASILQERLGGMRSSAQSVLPPG